MSEYDVIGLASALPAYPAELRASFEDDRGREDIVIRNDGHELTTTIRGVELSGRYLDDFEARGPAAATDVPLDLRSGSPAGTITVALSIGVVMGGVAEQASLEARLVVAAGREELLLTLLRDGALQVSSCGRHGWFDDELAEIAARLPDGVRLLSCWSCGLSDYSPYGYGLFGCLACFREVKDAYRATTGKREVFGVWNERTEWVQETHLCPDWEPRPRGRGYRG